MGLFSEMMDESCDLKDIIAARDAEIERLNRRIEELTVSPARLCGDCGVNLSGVGGLCPGCKAYRAQIRVS